MDITNSTGRTSASTLSFSADLLSLNISNLVQALVAGEETDAGRYYLRASNTAGEDSSSIQLMVFGEDSGNCFGHYILSQRGWGVGK